MLVLCGGKSRDMCKFLQGRGFWNGTVRLGIWPHTSEILGHIRCVDNRIVNMRAGRLSAEITCGKVFFESVA